MAGVNVIDLFSGAGGLSLAAKAAGGDVKLHVDFEQIACDTIQANSKFHSGKTVCADVAALTGPQLRKMADLDKSDPLVIVGGPPCQPFSKAAYWSEDGDDAAFRRARTEGKHADKPKAHGHREDERRFLIRDFLRLAIGSHADGFLFENVASLAAPRNRPMLDGFMNDARRAGFLPTLVKVNAAAYGVPQRRERMFILATRSRYVDAPAPTHTIDGSRERGLKATVTCGTLLSRYTGPKYFEPEEEVSGRWAEHLATVPPGSNYKAHTAWAGHPNPTFVTETRFWNFLLKLSPELPSWTIAASPGPWTGPFHWDTRRLRTPEMAAIQTFPHGYRFEGSRRERVRQIGNAAPPKLAGPMIGAVVDEVARARKTGR